ncbi:APC family permease [Scopulibacillus cellulosilyticus]|uniref:APC family permease n=1 Tax=Scopulibacillus cellulosilyticus TaxID=2665665 RepID=A0ABW2PY96_9BACL
MMTALKRILIGPPLKTEELKDQKIPKWKALPTLSSDALSSVAYGPEQILTVLAPIGAVALWYSLPIAGAIIFLLVMLGLSYRQIIHEYPGGGGAYIVSSDNLGTFGGLTAGSALLIDYTLTVAVSSSSGVAAISSAFPVLRPYTVLIGVFFVLLIMVLNLRGIRESGTIFSFPTYLFILGILGLVVTGLVKVLIQGVPSHVPPVTNHLPKGLTLFLLMRAFSSGCSSLTGVEAISNSTPNFKKPVKQNAARTLAVLVILLAILLAGVTGLAYLYHVVPNHETVLSQIAAHIFGHSVFYYYIQVTTALILLLACNTSFSAFPILASMMSDDKFLPRMFGVRGDRLNFSNGIIFLAVAAIVLIIAFEGNVNQLIPLYAIGVFLSFTLAQTGLVCRWIKNKPKHWLSKLVINLIGAILTFVVTIIFAVTKFTEGAWIVVILIPLLILIFYRIRRHFVLVGQELQIDIETDKPEEIESRIIIPVSGISKVVRNTIGYAKSIGGEAVALYIGFDEEDVKRMESQWEKWAPDVRLVTTVSRYRSVIRPLLRFIDHMGEDGKHRRITVLVPEFIPRQWWTKALHNQTGLMIRVILLFRKDVVISTVPYHLKH